MIRFFLFETNLVKTISGIERARFDVDAIHMPFHAIAPSKTPGTEHSNLADNEFNERSTIHPKQGKTPERWKRRNQRQIRIF